jgi:hypothetical protein
MTMPAQQQYCDGSGRVVDESIALDSNGRLRNGFGLRTPMHLMDSLQRSVAEFADRKRRKRTVARDPMGRELGTEEEEEEEEECGERQGRRRRKEDAATTTFTDSRGITFTDQRMTAAQDALDHLQEREEGLRALYRDGRAAVEAARQEMIDTLSSGRDAAPPAGASPYSAAAEGSECTINGQSGTLVKQGEWLVCKPRKDARPRTDSRPPPMSIADAEKTRDAAYNEMVAELGRGRDG